MQEQLSIIFNAKSMERELKEELFAAAEVLRDSGKKLTYKGVLAHLWAFIPIGSEFYKSALIDASIFAGGGEYEVYGRRLRELNNIETGGEIKYESLGRARIRKVR